MDIINERPSITRGQTASEQMKKRCFAPLHAMFGDGKWVGKYVAYKDWGKANVLTLFRVVANDTNGAPTVLTDWYYLCLMWNAQASLGGVPVNSSERAAARFHQVCIELASYFIAPADFPEDLLDG
jgi:hypothetical protein